MRRALPWLLLLGCSAPPAAPVAPTPAPAAPEPAAPEPAEPAPTAIEEDRGPPIAPDRAPAGAPRPPAESQAAIAAARNDEGIQLIENQEYAKASSNLRDAVARDPQPRYFFNLCLSLYLEGKFSEAFTACHAVASNAPTAQLQAKAEQLSARIKAAAQREGIRVE